MTTKLLFQQSSSTKSFNVKVGKTKKTATCDFSVSHTIEADGSATINSRSASCSINWPKVKYEGILVDGIIF